MSAQTHLVFFVPGDPRAKERPRTFLHKGSGKICTFTPKATREYENTVRAHARRAVALGTWRPPTVGDRFFVTLELAFRGEPRRDVDNVAKALLDGLQPFVLADDWQVARLLVARVMRAPRPGARVTVARILEVYAKPSRGLEASP